MKVSSHGGWGAFSRGSVCLPVGDLLAVRVLGLLGKFELSPADFFERVIGGGAFLAAMGGQAGTELERSELLVGEGLAGERVVLVAFDHRPAQAHELASGCDDRDLGAAAGADALIERAQR